jgi:hypothetical protein
VYVTVRVWLRVRVRVVRVRVRGRGRRMGALARKLLRLGRQAALRLRALRLIGQVGLPGRIERGQVTRQKSKGGHQRWQMGLL